MHSRPSVIHTRLQVWGSQCCELASSYPDRSATSATLQRRWTSSQQLPPKGMVSSCDLLYPCSGGDRIMLRQAIAYRKLLVF